MRQRFIYESNVRLLLDAQDALTTLTPQADDDEFTMAVEIAQAAITACVGIANRRDAELASATKTDLDG